MSGTHSVGERPFRFFRGQKKYFENGSERHPFTDHSQEGDLLLKR